MIALGIVLAVIVLLAMLPLGVSGEYGKSGYYLDVYAGLITYRIFPGKPKKQKPKKEKPPKPPAEPKPKEKKKGADLDFLMELVSAGIEALGRFKRGLCIRKLTVHYTAASSDPFSAAMQFGRAWAGAGYLVAVLRKNFRVKKLDLASDIDFDAKTPTVYARFKGDIALGTVIAIGVRFLVRFLKAKNSSKPAAETVQTQGKAE